ncbi:MAG: CHAP domain-containing protein [Ruminococcaceae bacterium]|nr:CHAP domain-containing protein [Oscillospiraceae bacterium]
MTRGELILQTASKEIGYHEDKGKRNKYGAWYGLDGEPWCMEFVQWVYHEAGFDLPFSTASCGALLRWYREHQPECVTDRPVRGCIVIFDFPGTAYRTDHTGLFVSCDGFKLTTIDGNTSGGNDANGGWVQKRHRTLGYANPVYIVPRELNGKEDDMKRYHTLEEIRLDAPWAAETVAKLVERGALNGTDDGLDLSTDMLREFVVNDRMGIYG